MENPGPWTAPRCGTKRGGGERQAAPPPTGTRVPPAAPPRHLPRGAIEHYEGRLEFWDADTEIAWVAEPTRPYHEQPVETLSALVDRIAAVRGSPVKCFGSMDLWLRGEHGPAAPHPAGRPVRLPLPGTRDPPRTLGDGDRRARLPRRGARGGPLHGRAPGASSGSTNRGASRRCGWRSRSAARGAGHGAAGRG